MRAPSLFDLGKHVPPDAKPNPNLDPKAIWSDQCLDAVACEGFKFIYATLTLCLEVLNVDWTLIGPARDAVGWYITYIKQTGCTHYNPQYGGADCFFYTDGVLLRNGDLY